MRGTKIEKATTEGVEDLKAQSGIHGSATLEEILRTNKPSLVGKGMLQLYMICFTIYFASTMNGYDGSLMSSINTLEQYLVYYNISGTGASTGLIFSIYYVGIMGGSLFIWLADFLGRRRTIALGCVGVFIGTIVVSTAKTLSIFIGGRFLLSFFSTIMSSASALYVIEISPPHIRGLVSGLFNTLYYLGSLIAAFTVLGTKLTYTAIDDTRAFRIALWLQMLCPGIVFTGVLFFPESPRWLTGTSQFERARNFLVKYHSNGEEDHPLVELEMAEMIASLQEVALSNPNQFLDLRPLLSTRSNGYRLLIIVCFAWFAQFSGNNVASYYLPTMLAQVGITNSTTQIIMNAVYAITGWIASTLGSWLHDRVGRRKMFLGSNFSMSICLACVAIATAQSRKDPSNKSASSATIAFIFIFGVCFAIGYTSMQPVYPGEIASNTLRAKISLIGGVVTGASSFVNQYAAPVAMQKISYWFYVFFVFWDLIEAAIIYFLFVETKGRTLEEIELIFSTKNPVQASLQPLTEDIAIEV
jgi:sugar porter (SP) family MFS transporter